MSKPNLKPSNSVTRPQPHQRTTFSRTPLGGTWVSSNRNLSTGALRKSLAPGEAGRRAAMLNSHFDLRGRRPAPWVRLRARHVTHRQHVVCLRQCGFVSELGP